MTARIFVHGNPETPIVWGPLLDALASADATFTPHLPGFGRPAPEGFAATKDDYVAWLESEVETIAHKHGPVDLVGHDWGGELVIEVADRRPDLIHSWASDVVGLLHPDYVWHDFAQVWQTPGAGEEMIESMIRMPRPDRIASMNAMGMPSPVADRLIDTFDAEFGRCVLALYRSAAQPVLAERGATLADIASRPGLAIYATEDPFGRSTLMTGEMAARTGASVGTLDGMGHWWMLQDPQRGARLLTDYWDGLDDGS